MAESRSYSRPWIRSGVILAIIEFLEREGYDPETVMGRRPLRMAEAYDAYRQVDMHYMWTIFQRVIDATGRRDWGLKLGLEADLNQLGPWGLMFLNAPTIGDALWDFVRYGPIFQTQTHFGLQRTRGTVCVEYSAGRRDLPSWEVDAEISVAYIMGIVNSLAGRKVVPLQVHMDHQRICNDREYFENLGVLPEFGRRICRVCYEEKIMSIAVKGANPNLYDVLDRHLNDLAAAMPIEDSLVSIVSNNIRRGLGSDTVTLEHVAAEMGLEARTLQRRLAEDGTSFQEIFDRVRLDVARYYLERTSFENAEIALELGYSQASAFSRAFKRWTGQSPASYRARR